MKHLLNNMSEEEKNAIREQHTGGMTVMTENFNKLLNSKLGDSKPLVSEQLMSRPSTPPISFTNKTVNLYTDAQNKRFYKKITIKSTNTSSNGEVILTIRANGFETLKFNCSNKGSLEYYNRDEDSSELEVTVYNTNLTNQLAKTFCSRSSGGSSVPKSDFASNSSNTGADFV